LSLIIVLACVLCAAHAFNSFAHRAMGHKNGAVLRMGGYDITGAGGSIPRRIPSIFAKDMELTAPLRERVESKVGKVLSKLGGRHVVSANVVLEVIKDSHIAEITVAFRGDLNVHASQKTDDMYSSIDLLSHKLAKALRRHHDKLVSAKRKGETPAVDADEVNDLLPLDDEELLVDLDEKYRGMAVSEE